VGLIAGGLALFAGLITVWVNKQTRTTVRLERERDAREALAFHAMLKAAMERVLAEAAWAKKTYSQVWTETHDKLVDAYAVRRCITKGAFAELRAACVRQGSPLTGEFLELEREIDSFASQAGLSPRGGSMDMMLQGKQAGLDEELSKIETKAAKLRDKAAERI
jgi:hypothetical protein